MNYAMVTSWWGLRPLQKLVKIRHFTFAWMDNTNTYRVKIPASDSTQLWVLGEIFHSKNYDVSRVPFTPDIILDLGANIGLFALLAAKQWPESTIVCVEPHPKTFYLLCENLQANRVIASKMQCAVSNKVSVQFMSDSGAAISECLTEVGDAKTKTFTVLLEALIPKDTQLNLLIKMDIEGAEFDVLSAVEGCLPRECFIFVEVHEGDASLKRITEWAIHNGFRYSMGRRAGEAIDGMLERP